MQLVPVQNSLKRCIKLCMVKSVPGIILKDCKITNRKSVRPLEKCSFVITQFKIFFFLKDLWLYSGSNRGVLGVVNTNLKISIKNACLPFFCFAFIDVVFLIF